MSCVEKYSIVDRGQYSSISNIEKISNFPLINMDYDYHLSLQTIAHLSTTSDIYFNKKELEDCLKDPLKKVCDNHKIIVESTISNFIYPQHVIYYRLYRNLVSDFLLWLIKHRGCNLKLKLNYSVEDDRFVIIKSKVSFKSLLFTYSPKELQPADIRLSMDDVENFMTILDFI